MDSINKTQTVCRVCLTEEGRFQSVFMTESNSGLTLNISEILNTCATIQMTKGDGLPDQICTECSEMTVKLYLFKLKCEKSDTVLRARKAIPIFVNENLAEIPEQLFKTEIKVENNNDAQIELLIEDFECENNLLFDHKIGHYLKIEYEDSLQVNTNLIRPSMIKKEDSIICHKEGNVSFAHEEDLDNHLSCYNKNGKDFFDSHKGDSRQKSGARNTVCTQGSSSIIRPLKGKRFFVCPICNASFTNCKSHTKHQKIHSEETKFKCGACKKEFSRLGHLVRHKRNHTGETPFKCDICRKKFTRSDGLAKHKRIHTGEKPYECDECEKKFSRQENLVSHKRTHTGEKPYVCDICSSQFSQLRDLKNHKISHTGEKPYTCEICKKKFLRSEILKRHKRIHTGEKPYECDICKMKFSRSESLVRHKRRHHE